MGWRPTLFFRVHKGSGGAGTITLEVTLNNSLVYTESFGSDVLRSLHEIVDSGILQEKDNKLVIAATAGSGTIEVSAMLLLYRAV